MIESVRTSIVRREADCGPRSLLRYCPRTISSFDGSPSVSENQSRDNHQEHQGTEVGKPGPAGAVGDIACSFPARSRFSEKRSAAGCIRAAAACPLAHEFDRAAAQAHRAILHALGLPPFVSKRTLMMFVETLASGNGGANFKSVRAPRESRR